VPSIPDAQAIADKLKEHKCFKDVKISRTAQFTGNKQKYVLEFEVKCEEKKPAKKKTGSTAEPADSATTPVGKEEGK
jgi:general secretion pathway protein L